MPRPRALACSLTAAIAFAACGPRSNAPLARGACRVVSSITLPTARGAAPVALARVSAYEVLALVVEPDGAHARAAVYHVRDDAPVALAAGPFAVDRAESVAGFARTPRGPAFAIASPGALVARAIDPRGVVHAVTFPHGEAPPGRDAVAPTLALASEPDGALAALVDFTGAFGTRRLHARDVGESVATTPRRRDTFESPALAVAPGALWLVQQRHVGAFTHPSDAPSYLELESLPADAHTPPDLRPAPLLDADPHGALAHVALAGARSLVVLYRDASSRFAAVVASLDAPGTAGTPVVLDERAAPGSWRAVELPGEAGVLIAWVTRDGRMVARVARIEGTSLAVQGAGLERSVGDGGARLELARAGGRVVLALDAGGAVRAFDATAERTGAVFLRPIALPGGAGRRLVGTAGDASRVVVATALGATVAFATLPAQGGARAAPRERVVDSDARAIGLMGDVVLVGGRAPRGGIRITRVEDGEPGEEVTAFGSRGDAFVMASSGEHDRVWVAEARTNGDELFGPAQAVVVQSFAREMDDGPHTDDRAGVVPWADFDRTTLDAVALEPGRHAWAASYSASRDAPSQCIPGAWVALRDRDDDAPIAPAAGGEAFWPAALPIVPAGERSCDDRVGAVRWSGSRFAATVVGPRAGVRLVVGDARAGTMAAQDVAGAVASPPPGLARGARGLVVVSEDARGGVWLARYGDDGRTRGARLRVGSATVSGGDAAIAVEADGAAGVMVGYAGAEGARVVRVECSE